MNQSDKPDGLKPADKPYGLKPEIRELLNSQSTDLVVT